MGTSAVISQRQNIVDGMRTLALKLEFGVSHNQTFESISDVHNLKMIMEILM
ncbi:hypothetical protein AMTR_s00003p00258540 [Amborella trichopoda]|uniref:Uncharacterized protein n=1 Tax=Amborella trichopoda TaxID=13333 RepID=W1P0N7_AMBTC|nr:hypothetical protein AMTR_s00003p00258540 [Amborella trichopoda]